MGQTSIEWTATQRPDGTFAPGYTFNPWRGCTKVAEGCKNCYAETMSKRNPSVLGEWGPNGKRIVAAESYWRQPLKWDKDAAAAGERRRVFCASLADVFEDWRGPMHAAGREPVYLGKDFRASFSPEGRATMDDVRARLFALIDRTSNLDWLLLTKRPQNIRRMWEPRGNALDNLKRDGAADHHRHNVWLLTSIAVQEDADRTLPFLRECRDLAPVLGVSAEPLVGPITADLSGIHWCIIGGESGRDARPMDLAWARSLVEQCRSVNVACFVKQLGPMPTSDDDGDAANIQPGTRYALGTLLLNDRKGGDPNEWPEDLRVREFPAARA